MKIDILLVCIYYGLFISNVNNTIISSFLPQYAEHEFGITESITGIIFASHSIGLLLASFIAGKKMNKKGMKKKFLISGIIIQAFGQGAFLILDIIEDKYIFIAVSVVGRFIVGAGMAFYNVPAYSYIPILYKENLEYQYGALEAVGGFGLAIGPVFGGFLYEWFGFYYPFIFSFLFSLLIVPMCFKFVPLSAKILLKERQKIKNEQNITLTEIDDDFESKKIGKNENLKENLLQKQIEDENYSSYSDSNQTSIVGDQKSNEDKQLLGVQQQDDGEESEGEFIEINYKEILGNRLILTSYIVVVLQNAAYVYLDPTLAPYLQDVYEKTPDFIGMLFFIQSAVYLLLCPFGSFVTRKVSSYKFLLVFGLIISGTAMFAMGPDPFFHLPHTVYMPVCACALIGFSTIFIYIPVLPDFNHSLGLLYPKADDETKGDMGSALFNSAFAIGSFIGPACGGFLVQLLGFPRSSTILGVCLIGYGVLYIFIGGVLTIRKTTTHNNLKQDEILPRPHRWAGGSFNVSRSNSRNVSLSLSFKETENQGPSLKLKKGQGENQNKQIYKAVQSVN